MVKVCPDTYLDNATYKEHFDMFPYPLSSFQKYAIEGIVTGNHVLVTAPTGSGKTLPAEFAIQHCVRHGKKVIYCSPIKALSNQKNYEFTKKYPSVKFGLFTGDIKTNPEADVLIMTTEILMNYLFTQLGDDVKESVKKEVSSLNFQIDIQNELGCVIFDEIHYINDQERGQVWEKTILMLPEHIQIIGLSATIDNPQGFAQWIEDRYINKIVYLASTNHRVVPLSHYGFIATTEAIFKVVKDKDTQKQIRDNSNTLIPLQDSKGKYNDAGYLTVKKYTKMLEDNRVHIGRKHTLNQLSIFLRDREMLPAIAFVFSRKNVEAMAKDVTIPLLEDDSKIPYTVRRECEQVLRKLPNFTEYLQLPEYLSLVALLEKGIGIHHSGMIPVLREIVELMISKRYIKLLFATESFAIGLDCPIRTAIFTSLTKFDGQYDRYLLAHEYTQMAGRAGRRGIDKVGHVVHCNNLFKVPTMNEYKTILGGVPQTLVSKFYISYGLVLNLMKNGPITADKIYEFCEKSMIKGELNKASYGHKIKIAELETMINKKEQTLLLCKTPVEVCRQYLELEETIKISVNKKRKECEREISYLKDKYKNLIQDIHSVKLLDAMISDLHAEQQGLDANNAFIKTKVDGICKVLCDNGYIVRDETLSLLLTMSGKIASSLAEVHPLIMAKTLIDTELFKTHPVTKSSSVDIAQQTDRRSVTSKDDLGFTAPLVSVKPSPSELVVGGFQPPDQSMSPIQLIGIFSCFTDIKIAEEMRSSVPNSNDDTINKCILNMCKSCDYYEKIENELELCTGIHYDKLLMFDMIQYSMEWCNCTTEQECKYFIQAVISEKGISVGDFTKAMMKIVTIAKELENVCETVFAGEQVDLLHKLRQIEGLVLKYVLTSQSLYV